MKKIFKYDIVEINGKKFAELPKGYEILRCGEVYDDFYSGDFVWCVVDPAEVEMIKVEITKSEYESHQKKDRHSNEASIQLGVQEKQTLDLDPDHVFNIFDEDGKIYTQCSSHVSDGKRSEILFYKTGQEIKVDLNKYRYLGCGAIWICQELCLYAFLRKESI